MTVQEHDEGKPIYRLSAAQIAEVELAQHEVREGKIATEAEMAEVWRRFER